MTVKSSSSNETFTLFVGDCNYLYDYRSNWTPLGPVTIFNRRDFVRVHQTILARKFIYI